jgi:hypothetical protein
MAGNLSNRVTGWLTVDNTKPVVSAPISAAQTLKYEDTSTSNMQMNEDGFLYAVKNGEAVDTTQAIVAAWQNSKGIQVKSGSTADTPYFITLPENGLEDGVYDLVGYDRAGNVADAIAGWLTVDNTKPIVSAATATAQTLKYEDTSTSTMQMNEAGTLWLVLTGETANSEATITTAYGANKAIRVKTSADADTAYVVNMPEDNLTDGVYDLVGVDNAGNVSDIVPGWLTVDNTPPVVTASSNTGVRVKEGNTSSLTMQINEVGTLYLVKNGLAINSPSDLQTAITNNQAFIAAADVAADTAQYARVPAGLEEALYDVIGVDKAGLLSNRVIGWLTADNTKPVVSAPISAAQTL